MYGQHLCSLLVSVFCCCRCVKVYFVMFKTLSSGLNMYEFLSILLYTIVPF